MMRVRLAGLAGFALLLLVIPAGVGLVLLRQPAAASVAPTAESVNTTISEEVFESVLSPPTAEPGAGQVTVPPAAAPTEDSRIGVMRDGVPVSIANGQAVQVTDDLLVEIFVSPYPPASFEADLDLYLTTAKGEPVRDAEIDIEYDMLHMSHGRLVGSVSNLGNGHYLTPLEFAMYGSWALDTSIQVPGQGDELSLPIVIDVWPK